MIKYFLLICLITMLQSCSKSNQDKQSNDSLAIQQNNGDSSQTNNKGLASENTPVWQASLVQAGILEDNSLGLTPEPLTIGLTFQSTDKTFTPSVPEKLEQELKNFNLDIIDFDSDGKTINFLTKGAVPKGCYGFGLETSSQIIYADLKSDAGALGDDVDNNVEVFHDNTKEVFDISGSGIFCVNEASQINFLSNLSFFGVSLEESTSNFLSTLQKYGIFTIETESDLHLLGLERLFRKGSANLEKEAAKGVVKDPVLQRKLLQSEKQIALGNKTAQTTRIAEARAVLAKTDKTIKEAGQATLKLKDAKKQLAVFTKQEKSLTNQIEKLDKKIIKSGKHPKLKRGGQFQTGGVRGRIE